MEWDGKITTFPGLYFVGAAWAKLLHFSSVKCLPIQVCLQENSVPCLFLRFNSFQLARELH